MINLFSGDVSRIGWMYPQPIEYNNGLKKIKPFVELYESEIVFYAFHSGIEFQTEQCPYMNESIRSEFRLFFNELEKIHPGIKYNCFKSMNKISKIVKTSEKNEPVKNSCINCGETSSNNICSVCTTIQMLNRNKKIFIIRNYFSFLFLTIATSPSNLRFCYFVLLHLFFHVILQISLWVQKDHSFCI